MTASRPHDPVRTSRVRGCLLGGAVGDALGAPVEFLSLELREEITTLADDLVTGYREGREWWERYPGW